MTTLDAMWKNLATIALVGTERGGGEPFAASGHLGELLAGLDPADAEGRLLGAATAVALQRRAGRLPAPGPIRPVAPCQPDEGETCPPQAAEHLGAMLSGIYREALPEWLGALAAANRLVPPAHLPALLALGRDEAELRPRILPVLGRRGRWLAALNPAWDYAAAPGIPNGASVVLSSEALLEQWETGSRAARLTLLQQLRAREPAAGLALVEASWRAERADERAAMLRSLTDGLSMSDEPFLETALDDRSAQVRATAADLLARLPASRLAARMAERATALLRWTPGESSRLLGLRPARPPKLIVELPAEPDKQTQRDGVELKGGGPGMGERAWWLNQMVARTPPSAWQAAFGAPSVAIVHATIDDEWRQTLLRAWAEATRRYNDLEWAEALLDLALANQAGDLDIAGLTAMLPPPRQEQIILTLLHERREPLAGDHPALAPLRAYNRPWSHELGAAVLASLRRRLQSLAPAQLAFDWHLRAAIEEFARQIPPDLAPEAAAVWEGKREELPYWGDTIERFQGLIAFRYEMLKALV